MAKAVEIGQRWLVRLHGRPTLTVVRITGLRIEQGYSRHGLGRNYPTRWRADAIHEATDKPVVIKSTSKLRHLLCAPEAKCDHKLCVVFAQKGA